MKIIWLICLAMNAELLDRVAVSVGNQVITETELISEIRLNAFLNHEPVNLSVQSKRAAADRLIEQKLVKKEMELGRYPPASAEEAIAMMAKLETRARNKGQFNAELKAAGITAEELQQHLLWGLTLAHFIDVRFRPAVQVTRRDVEKYYQEKVLPAGGKQKPSLEEVRAQIEQTLSGERSDQQMDEWLKEARARSSIVYRKEVFGEEKKS